MLNTALLHRLRTQGKVKAQVYVECRYEHDTGMIDANKSLLIRHQGVLVWESQFSVIALIVGLLL